MKIDVDMVDLAIFDMLKDYAHAPVCKKMQDDGKNYFSVPYKKVLEELPLLPIKTPDGVYRRYKKLELAGLIEMHENNARMAMVWFSWGRNYSKMIHATPGYKSEGSDIEQGEPSDEKPYPPRMKNRTPSDEKPTHTKPFPIPYPIPLDNTVAAKPPNPEEWEGFEVVEEIEIEKTPIIPLKAKKEKTPPGSARSPNKEKEDPWTKTTAALFDRVASEEGAVDAFNWAINAGRDFKALKSIRDALQKDMQAKLNHEPTDAEMQVGFEYLFRYGYRYLAGIAKERGGAVQFSPLTIKNCYNQIIGYAKANNGRNPKEPINKATRQHDELADYVAERRRASIVRLYSEQVADLASAQ